MATRTRLAPPAVALRDAARRWRTQLGEQRRWRSGWRYRAPARCRLGSAAWRGLAAGTRQRGRKRPVPPPRTMSKRLRSSEVCADCSAQGKAPPAAGAEAKAPQRPGEPIPLSSDRAAAFPAPPPASGAEGARAGGGREGRAAQGLRRARSGRGRRVGYPGGGGGAPVSGPPPGSGPGCPGRGEGGAAGAVLGGVTTLQRPLIGGEPVLLGLEAFLAVLSLSGFF